MYENSRCNVRKAEFYPFTRCLLKRPDHMALAAKVTEGVNLPSLAKVAIDGHPKLWRKWAGVNSRSIPLAIPQRPAAYHA